jgi:hypothetical protein
LHGKRKGDSGAVVVENVMIFYVFVAAQGMKHILMIC